MPTTKQVSRFLWFGVPVAIVGLVIGLADVIGFGDADRSTLKPGSKATVYGPPGTAAIKVEASFAADGIDHILVGTRVTILDDRGAPRPGRPVAIRFADRNDDVREAMIERQYLRPVAR